MGNIEVKLCHKSRSKMGESGSFTLYEDAGDGYGYEKGEYCLTHITYCDNYRSVAWKTEKDTGFRKGDFVIEII